MFNNNELIANFRRSIRQGGASARGMSILLLHTTGGKSGLQRTTPVMYIEDGDNYVITASNNGRGIHPAWFLNLQASPNVEIEVPAGHLKVTATMTTQAERDRLWPQLVEKASFFADYEKGTTRQIPIVILHPDETASKT